MQLKVNSHKNKISGVYYTPYEIVESLLDKLEFNNNLTLLEPSCGEGIFFKVLKDKRKLKYFKKLQGIEIEEESSNKTRENFLNEKNIEILTEDFFDFYFEAKKNKKSFDLILGNPPFIRYQFLEPDQRELFSKILNDNNIRPNKLINAWAVFLIACTTLLNNNGVECLIIPAELLQVSYAKQLRDFLVSQLSEITVVSFKKLIFPNIEQEVLFFFGKKGEDKAKIRIIELEDLNHFKKISLDDFPFQRLSQENEKWIRYYLTPEENLLIENIRNDKNFLKLSELGLVNVGVTTGNNDYFSLNEEVTEKYNLGSFTLPLIGRGSHTDGLFYDEENWKKNIIEGKKARLLTLPSVPMEEFLDETQRYLQVGVEKGIPKGYKCRIRNHWYSVPSIWIPDAFFLRRSGSFPRLILNEFNAISTDTMHRIKIKDKNKRIDFLLSYYNSITFAFTEILGRSYGGGVLEMMPTEVMEIPLPKLDGLSEEKKKELIEKIDKNLREKANIEEVLDITDQELLIEHLGMNKRIVVQARKIWKKLQSRRLARN